MEALVAMVVFAVGVLMLLPSMFAWTRANTVSMQRDEIVRMMESEAAYLQQMGGGQLPWTNNINTAPNYSQALNTLDGLGTGALTDLGTAPGFNTPLISQNAGVTASALYAVVAITDSGGNVVSNVMRLQFQWQGPTGRTLSNQTIIQR
jgi:type II secretory pathway pseudopilin PulG